MHADMIATQLSETELVMMNVDRGIYYGLEDVGKTIWDSLAEPRSVKDLCEVVLQSYAGAEQSVVESEVFGFLSDLLEENLVQVQN